MCFFLFRKNTSSTTQSVLNSIASSWTNMSDEEVSWRTPLSLSIIAFLCMHTYTLTFVVHSRYSELVSFQHICPLLPACGLPVFISERNDLRCNVQRSSAPYVSRYGALYTEISPLFGIWFLPVRRETSLHDVQEVRSLKVWDMAQVNPLESDNQSPSATSKTSRRADLATPTHF